MSTATPPRSFQPRPRPSMPPRPKTSKMAPNVDPVRVLRRHMFLLIFMGILGAGLGVGAYFGLANVYALYTAQARFRIQPGLSESSDFGTDDGNLNDEDVARQAETESLMLTSRETITKGLRNTEIRTTEWHKQFVKDGVFNIEEAADELEEDIGAGLIRGTLFFQVYWTTTYKDDAPVIVNAIAGAYNDTRVESEAAIWNDNFLEFDARLDKVNREIEGVQSEIERFILERGITVLDSTQFSQTARTLETLAAQLAGVEAEASYAETQYAQVRAKLTGTLEPTQEDYFEAEQDLIVMPMSRQVLDLKTTLRTLRDKYPDDNPQIVQAMSILNAAILQRDEKIEEVVQLKLEASQKVLKDQIESFTRQRERLDGEIREYEERMTQLAADHAEYQSKEIQREQLESSREAIRNLIHEIELLRVRADAKRVVMSQEAKVPREMTFPQLETMVPLGLVVCVGLTLGVIFLRELTDQRIKGASDIEVVPHGNVLGVIPDVTDDPTRVKKADLVVARKPQSVMAESYRLTAAPVLRGIDTAGHQTIMFTSGLPGTGTTTVIGNLAATMSATGRRVLIIDANFRRPAIAKMYDQPADGPGLGDVLAGDSTLEDVTHVVNEDLSIIGAGTPATRIFERLNKTSFDALLAECRGRFDLILIDTPPAVVAGDAFVIASKVDAAVLIIRAFKEHRGLVSRLISQFGSINCDLLGTILNRPRTTVGGYFKKNFDTMARYSEKSKKGA